LGERPAGWSRRRAACRPSIAARPRQGHRRTYIRASCAQVAVPKVGGHWASGQPYLDGAVRRADARTAGLWLALRRVDVGPLRAAVLAEGEALWAPDVQVPGGPAHAPPSPLEHTYICRWGGRTHGACYGRAQQGVAGRLLPWYVGACQCGAHYIHNHKQFRKGMACRQAQQQIHRAAFARERSRRSRIQCAEKADGVRRPDA
jgi:hypothetical protein